MIFPFFWTKIGREKNVETKMKNNPKYRNQKDIFTFLLSFFLFFLSTVMTRVIQEAKTVSIYIKSKN